MVLKNKTLHENLLRIYTEENAFEKNPSPDKIRAVKELKAAEKRKKEERVRQEKRQKAKNFRFWKKRYGGNSPY